mgnify:CR=1 FL=1|jgi:hypothetical protein
MKVQVTLVPETVKPTTLHSPNEHLLTSDLASIDRHESVMANHCRDDEQR